MAPNNPLPCWGNDKTMNMNPLILTNIQSSPYFKVNLYELKTYHEVIDEIYYKVSHLEPWEKGSRKTAGQTGMCGGVRGVGAGGIVSSAYCLLYKLFTLKLTRKQVIGLCEHSDSPYIRGLGFMYIRYTQDPKELWDWFEPYLDDEEEVDVKAGGGHTMLIGEMIKQWLTKLEWYSTLFPRIPVPIQKDLEQKLRAVNAAQAPPPPPEPVRGPQHIADEDVNFGEAERHASRRRSASPARKRSPPRHRSPPPRSRSSPPRKRSPHRHRSPPRNRSPSRRSPHRHRRSPPRYRSRSPKRRSPDGFDYAKELQREKERQNKERDGGRDRHRSRSRSRDHIKSKKHRSRSRSRDRKRHKEHREHKEHRDHKERRRRSRSTEKGRDRNGHV